MNHNLSEAQLAIGDIESAIHSAHISVVNGDALGDDFYRMSALAILAHAFHEAAEIENAHVFFQKAEALQHVRGYERLYFTPSFRYSEFLLDQGKTTLVLEQAEDTLEVAVKNGDLLSIALTQLTFGRMYLQLGDLSQAVQWLDQAVNGLRLSERQDYLPRGLLARAALYRHTRDFARARQDLQEVFDIADGSGMRLHLTDYHLEMARLLVAESLAPCPPCGGRVGEGGNSREAADPAYHIAAAAKLINETGYHRRDQELLELQAALT